MADLIQMDYGHCFVMQPFDKGRFDKRYKEVFKPAITVAHLVPYRVDEDSSADILIEKIEKQISESTVGFAEITTDNPNVWYELGYAMAKGKQVCLVCSTSERLNNPFPFDIRHRNIITYEATNPSDFESLRGKITARLNAMLDKLAKIATVTELKATTEPKGLTDHEMAALTLILAQSHIGEVNGRGLVEDMFKAGYTNIATSLAIAKLKRARYIDANTESWNNDVWEVYSLTEKGVDWLIQNEHRLSLKVQSRPRNVRPSEPPPPPDDFAPPVKDDDIPF